jgi:sugar lactone lactonase YvrE
VTPAPINSMSSGPSAPTTSNAQKSSKSCYQADRGGRRKAEEACGGFTFTEGPTWLKGKLYFSDMYFKDAAGGDFTGSPARSRLIVMEPNGKYRALSSGMQSNGTVAAKNGNLIVCDMFGHRVVEAGAGDRTCCASRAGQD